MCPKPINILIKKKSLSLNIKCALKHLKCAKATKKNNVKKAIYKVMELWKLLSPFGISI
jgi:hypothetical protein